MTNPIVLSPRESKHDDETGQHGVLVDFVIDSLSIVSKRIGVVSTPQQPPPDLLLSLCKSSREKLKLPKAAQKYASSSLRIRVVIFVLPHQSSFYSISVVILDGIATVVLFISCRSIEIVVYTRGGNVSRLPKLCI